MPRPFCQQCQRPTGYCYCAQVIRVCNRWPVVIVQDAEEARHALGTARIAHLSLSNSTLLTVDTDKSATTLPIPSNAVLIYPSPTAQPLSTLKAQSPVPLVFLDASWRKAFKMTQLYPQLQQLPACQLTSVPPSRYRIRRQPGQGHLSTLEAIVASLSVLEDEPLPLQSMLNTMDWMINRQIERMGADVFKRFYGIQEYDHE